MTAIHQIRFPTPALQPFIKCYLDICMGVPNEAVTCVLPAKLEQCIFFSTGNIPVVEDLSKRQGNILSPGKCCNVRGGVSSSTLELQITGQLDMFVVIFHPTGFFRFFGIPASHFSETFTPATISLGKEWELLGLQVREMTTIDEKKTFVERYLLHLLDKNSCSPDYIDAVTARLLQAPGLPVHLMAKQSFLSERQFRRKFTERTGLSPQAFARISRINFALKTKRLNPHSSWRSIAFETGYTDQSHFRKEMRSLMGIIHPAGNADEQFVDIEGTNFKLLSQK
jgi:AraC-like DNA-binding protein